MPPGRDRNREGGRNRRANEPTCLGDVSGEVGTLVTHTGGAYQPVADPGKPIEKSRIILWERETTTTGFFVVASPLRVTSTPGPSRNRVTGGSIGRQALVAL